jgi:hypothetical protein
LYLWLNPSTTMNIDPKYLWSVLSPTLRRQIVDDVAAVLAEVAREVRTGEVEPSGAQGGRLIRQSTPHQIVSNQESLRLQYALRQRARELGWHEADIDVIDADLGLSGASAAQRSGFKELVGPVGLSEVGLILSIDVTRLARNCSDWYPLLDICGLRGCLIADRDGVYDPGSPNGRLLLGLKGTISELELSYDPQPSHERPLGKSRTRRTGAQPADWARA